MGFGDWLLHTAQSGSHWVDEHVFGREQPKTQYRTVNGERLPVLQKFDDMKLNNPVSRNVGKPMESGFEKVMSGLNWLYDNGVSQPISTYLLATTSSDTSVGDLLHASTWGKAWHVAEHVSPGQAFWATNDEAAKIMKGQPLYAKPSAAALPPGFDNLSEDEQQAALKKAGMPIVGNRAVEKIKRDVSFYNFASGATDFAARSFLDPTIIGGKAVGAARTAKMVKPRPAGGWTQGNIDELINGSNMAKARKFLWENKDNPQTINNLSMFQKSALGPRAGGIISTLKSPEEVTQFLRVTMGDVEARAALEQTNKVAARQMQLDTSRLSDLELNLSRFKRRGQERYADMVQQRMDEVQSQINANEDLVGRYQGMLDHYGELDAINLTRGSFARAERRTKAQNAYVAGPALGFSRVGQDYWGSGMTVVRSLEEAHPSGHVRIDDIHADSVAEVRAHLSRIPGITGADRQELLNRYLNTKTEGERLDVLDEIGFLGVGKVAQKHGLDAETARAIFDEHKTQLAGGKEQLRRYSAGTFPDEAVHLDEFMSAGGRLSVHPNMVTRLVNDHVLFDLGELDRILRVHGDGLKALMRGGVKAKDLMVEGADWFNHLWKFGTLFRMGYIPRVLGDDLAGQMARLGTASMVMRTGYGVKNLATNLASWKRPSFYEAREASLREGVKYADEELKPLLQEADYHRGDIAMRREIAQRDLTKARDRQRRATNALNALGPDAPAATVRARQALVAKHGQDVRRLEDYAGRVGAGKAGRLAQLDDQITNLQAGRDNALSLAEEAKAARERGFRQSSQLYREPMVGGGVALPSSMGGERGEYYQKMISSDQSLENVFASNKKMLHGNLMRSYDQSSTAISYPQNAKLFVAAWHKAINHQIMQDELAKQAVAGASIPDMAKWLSSTPAGRSYRRRLGMRYENDERIASSVWHDVDQYLPAAEVRQAALEGKADPEFLTRAAEQGLRPFEVHTGQLAENMASSAHMRRAMDRIIDGWFKTVASMPADRFSRHPLFNQLYEGHAKTLASQEFKQGVKIGQKDADRIAETARRLALRDTRRLVFDIAHRSDAAHALRFISPFFAATTEAFQRWARIIADRPQTVGYAANFFNAPMAAGVAVDMDGNHIMRDGTVIDPVTGKKRLVPKGERRILVRVPKFLVSSDIGKALGLDSLDNKVKGWSISQNSMNMITQGDPWFNPGTGPMVAIPVNELVKDKPSQAELARHLGILPFGPETGSFGENVYQQAMPSTVKNFLTAFDTSDERYQAIKLQIMQKAAYEHANLGKPMPSAKEIAAQTRNYWLFSAATAFIQPFATSRSDKYQFFRDQYNALRRKNPLTADQEFLDRFHESHFIFAQATSKGTGVPPTKKATALFEQYREQIAKNPELAALIIGPEGEGPFSPEAYAYQLTTPLIPGGAEMMRTRMSADEAMKENQRRLGWAKYTGLMNQLTAELHKQGFESFSDEGAQELDGMRRMIPHLYGDPLMPDGSANPRYNAEWSRDFYTLDARRYDRLIPALTQVAHSDLAKDPNRSDLRTLQQYLLGRQALLAVLAERGKEGGAKTLGAKANADVAKAWGAYVDGLIESDTRFGDLHHRYLARDMGVDVGDMQEGA